jgi:hypothetical protein
VPAVDLLVRLQGIDRRVIFTLVFLAAAIPFYVSWPPVRIDVAREVEDAYKIIDAIPPDGHPLLLSIDYDPASAAELTPMAVAVLRHCFSKNIRVLVISLNISGQGAGIAAEIVPKIAAEYGKKRDVDWAFLGLQPNAVVAMMQIGEDIQRAFPRDYYGTPTSQIPLMAGVQNYDQIPAVLTLAASAVGEAWAVYAGSRYGATVLAGLTAVYAADVQPFYQSGQIKGLLGGMKGAAEYERRIGRTGDATAGMRSQKVVHYGIILLMVLGNITFFLKRRRTAP